MCNYAVKILYWYEPACVPPGYMIAAFDRTGSQISELQGQSPVKNMDEFFEKNKDMIHDSCEKKEL